MKKTIKPKKLMFTKNTIRILTTNDLKDVVGGTDTLGPTSSRCSVLVACPTDEC